MKEIIFKVLIIFLPLLSACSVLKNISKKSSKSKLSQESSLQKDSSSYSVLASEKAIMMKDSVDEELYTEIVPLGAFTYNPQQGFTGQALSIRIKGKSKRVQQAEGSVKFSALKAENLRMENYENMSSIRLNQEVVKKVEKKTDWVWGLAFAIIAVLFLLKVKSLWQRIY